MYPARTYKISFKRSSRKNEITAVVVARRNERVLIFLRPLGERITFFFVKSLYHLLFNSSHRVFDDIMYTDRVFARPISGAAVARRAKYVRVTVSTRFVDERCSRG